MHERVVGAGYRAEDDQAAPRRGGEWERGRRADADRGAGRDQLHEPARGGHSIEVESLETAAEYLRIYNLPIS